MSINLAALSVVHPDLGVSVQTRMPYLGHVHRNNPATQVNTSDAALGYGDVPESAPSTLVGHFPCQYGPYRNRDGKQIVTADGVQVTQPYQVVFYAQDGALVEAGDTISVNERIFKVIVPPPVGSFDVMVSALCQLRL